MKSALILLEDENLLNRVKVTLHNDEATLHYVDTADDAVTLMNETEIAVAIIPYHFDVLNGNELIGMLLDNNPKLQIILFFNEDDLDDVVKSHNTYHICKLICTDNLKLEELNHKLDEAFYAYNREDEIKKIEIEYRQKEDVYKKTLMASSSLLNGRMAGYDSVEKLFGICLQYMLEIASVATEESTIISAYFDSILDEYISLMLKREPEIDKYFELILNSCHKPDENKYFMISFPKYSGIDHEILLNITFIVKIMTMFCLNFYKKYRGKATLKDNKDIYVLDIVFEGLNVINDPDLYLFMESFLKKMSAIYADKVSFGKKERTIQYRLQFLRHKNSNEQ